MLYQIIIALGLVSFMLNLILNLRSLKSPSSDSKIPVPAPLISVLVPARDEEANIEVCLKSLQEQDYPNFEILVLDDDSSDNTANIVAQIATKDDRIRLVRGEPLLEGWAGKPFAWMLILYMPLICSVVCSLWLFSLSPPCSLDSHASLLLHCPRRWQSRYYTLSS
jgi:cellulose synthase/poly-beta-1,6-N-acetylglucosamine synthase-like glycosyltransferase